MTRIFSRKSIAAAAVASTAVGASALFAAPVQAVFLQPPVGGGSVAPGVWQKMKARDAVSQASVSEINNMMQIASGTDAKVSLVKDKRSTNRLLRVDMRESNGGSYEIVVRKGFTIKHGTSSSSTRPLTSKVGKVARYWCVATPNTGGTSKYAWITSKRNAPKLGDKLPVGC